MLKAKQVIRLPDGRRARVIRVTPCAATVQPLGREKKTVNGRSFKAKPKTIRISANSEVEILNERR